jgi:retinol dehydrogenase 12
MSGHLRSIAVVTGTTHGIGRVTAHALARAGFDLRMLVRDTRAGADLRAEILREVPSADIRVVACDLASLASVRAAARELRVDGAPIACLINNAGIVSTLRSRSVDGYERVFATNHLGPFLLTGLLLDRIADGGQIINVASREHFRATLDLGQVADPAAKPYRPRAVYAQSKLANVLHAFALARRLADRGVRANCLHPGVVKSNLLPAWLRPLKPLVSPGMFDIERGARTTLYLALDPSASTLTGQYVDEHQRVQAASNLARDEALQEALWTASCRWVGWTP